MLVTKGSRASTEVVLSAFGRTFRPDDRLPDGTLAKDTPGIENDELYQHFTNSPRRKSPGHQFKPYRLVGVGVKVPIGLKRHLRREADKAGMKVSSFIAKTLAEAVGYKDPHWRPK